MYFLNINKPKGITSFDVISKLRRRLNIKQIGHAGTLDPLASGVMQIGVSKAAKLLDYLNSDKTYIADIRFGYVTSTYDDEGEKIFIAKPDFTKDDLVSCLNLFIGDTMQTPPKFSAIKIDGKKLYSLARKNIEVEIPKRPIKINEIKLLDFNGDCARIEVDCKKGTYIRSLAFDIGQKLECGAYLTDLKRTRAGVFKIENSNNIDDDVLNEINPLDVLNFEKYELNDEEYKRVICGNFIKTEKEFKTEKILLTKNNKLVSMANLSDNLIKPKKIFEGN